MIQINYVDPASTSRVNTVSFVSGASFGPYLQFNNQSNLRLQAGQQSGAIGISGYDFNGNWRFQLYGDSSGYGFLNGNWAGWDIKKIVKWQSLFKRSNFILHWHQRDILQPCLWCSGY